MLILYDIILNMNVHLYVLLNLIWKKSVLKTIKIENETYNIITNINLYVTFNRKPFILSVVSFRFHLKNKIEIINPSDIKTYRWETFAVHWMYELKIF